MSTSSRLPRPVRSEAAPAAVQLTAALTREDDSYVARCLDVEVTSQGHILEEALANLREALELYSEGADPPADP